MRFAEVLNRAAESEVMALREEWKSGFITIADGRMDFIDAYGSIEYMAPAEDALADDWVMI